MKEVEKAMRIGGNILLPYEHPDEWLKIVRDLGYSTVLSPVKKENATEEEIKAYVTHARQHNITIGEVGVWNNPMALDADVRKEAIDYCIRRLHLADELGANCCVNIAGARGEGWASLYEDNYTDDTYALVVDTIREIIDAVKPTRTFYTIESMPWMVPDSPEQYLKLLKDVDRSAFGVHLDFVNMINSPKKYAQRDAFIKSCFDLLGPHIKSIHLKDIKFTEVIPCHLEECQPGYGDLNFGKILQWCEGVDTDISVFVEHMSQQEDYKQAVKYIRDIAKTVHVHVI